MFKIVTARTEGLVNNEMPQYGRVSVLELVADSLRARRSAPVL